MCVGSIRGLERMGILGDLETCAAALVKGKDRQVLDQHRRAGEIVLLVDHRQQALTGAAAFRWILQRRFPGALTAPLSWPPIFLLMTLGYRLVASSRRIWIPPQMEPDPLFAEPSWVSIYRSLSALVVIVITPLLISLTRSNIGLVAEPATVISLDSSMSILLMATILIGNALFVTTLGIRRLVDLLAVQSWVFLVSSVLSSGLIWITALFMPVPLQVICMAQVILSAIWIQSYWVWLGFKDEKKGLTAQLTTTLAVALGGATLWTGYDLFFS